MITRREMLLSTIGGCGSLLLAPRLFAQGAAATGPYTLPPLPYAYDALEPHIDAETMTIHHTKHHQAYIDKLNAALAAAGPTATKEVSIAELVAGYKSLPEALQTAVRNQGGGHLNHSWFWTMMAKPGTGGAPSKELTKDLDASFGGMDGFKKELLAKATGQFGSGWAWLVKNKAPGRPLALISTANQDNPISDEITPILGIDVWEHAYYLKYRNQRPAYVEAWCNLIHWNRVNELHK